MNVKEIIKKFKLALRSENLVAYNTSDGLVINTDDLSVGSTVTVINPDGTETPAPDQEYVLDDGTNVTVIDGVITEIESAAAETAEDAIETDEEVMAKSKVACAPSKMAVIPTIEPGKAGKPSRIAGTEPGIPGDTQTSGTTTITTTLAPAASGKTGNEEVVSPTIGNETPEFMSVEDLSCAVKKLQAENLEMKALLVSMAEKTNCEALEKDIKMSMVEPINLKKVNIDEKPLNKVNGKLDKVFSNMYK